MQLGDRPSETRAEQRPRGDGAEGPHGAPALEPRQRPDRELLEAERVGSVGARETDHFLQEGSSLRWHRVPVKDVPGADEKRQRRS